MIANALRVSTTSGPPSTVTSSGPRTRTVRAAWDAAGVNMARYGTRDP